MASTSPGQHAATDDAGLRPAGPERGVGAALLAGGLVGAVVSLVLLLDELALLADPGYVPSCSIDPVLSCGTIMRTEQAAVLGFPNPVLGLLTYPVVAALGALVLGGVALPRRAWWGPQAGTTAGMLFVHWLIAQSLGVIGALCPWCMAVWVATIGMFWCVTVTNARGDATGAGSPAAPSIPRARARSGGARSPSRARSASAVILASSTRALLAASRSTSPASSLLRRHGEPRSSRP